MREPDILEGQFFPPLSSKSQAARLSVAPGTGIPCVSAALADGTTVDGLAVDDLQARDTLHFRGGSSFKADRPLPPEIAARFQGRLRRRIAALEAFSPTKALVMGLALVLCVLFVRAALPLAARGIALALPDRLEQLVGEHTYATLRRIDLSASELPERRRQTLRRRSDALAEAAHLTRRPEIVFHRSRIFGANAMALPGGPIVVTDDLVGLLGSDDAVLAVIAHEMAHVENRHAMQQVLALAGAAAMASIVLGVDDSLLEELSATLINVWSFNNGRNFEKEADLAALDFLRAGGLDPALFVTAIEKLTARACADVAEDARARCLAAAGNAETGWLSSHPGAKERLGYLRQALGG